MALGTESNIRPPPSTPTLYAHITPVRPCPPRRWTGRLHLVSFLLSLNEGTAPIPLNSATLLIPWASYYLPYVTDT